MPDFVEQQRADLSDLGLSLPFHSEYSPGFTFADEAALDRGRSSLEALRNRVTSLPFQSTMIAAAQLAAAISFDRTNGVKQLQTLRSLLGVDDPFVKQFRPPLGGRCGVDAARRVVARRLLRRRQPAGTSRSRLTPRRRPCSSNEVIARRSSDRATTTPSAATRVGMPSTTR